MMMMNEPALEERLALLDNLDQPLSKRYLSGLSNLDSQQVSVFQQYWRVIFVERRVEIVRSMVTLAEDNVDLNFSPIFYACLDDPDATVRATAVDGLWEDESNQILQRLLQLTHDPASEVRIAAMINLGRFAYRAELGDLGYEDAQMLQTAMLRVCSDPMQPLEVQRRAVEGLGYFANSSEAQAEVERAYANSDQRMRESALVAMGRSMRGEWFSSIEQELHSSSPSMRYAAAQAVGEFGEEGQPLLGGLLPLIDDDDSEVAMAAIWALGQIGGNDARRVLQRLARSKDVSRRQAAYDALGELSLDEL